MLLFINTLTNGITNIRRFQYISCYSLSTLRHILRLYCQVSIHLMLLFITDAISPCDTVITVSIHLMLLFIKIPSKTTGSYLQGFNTSHVTLYRNEGDSSRPYIISFNTSHVTLYRVKPSELWSLEKFQYISCYSLSFCELHPYSNKISFNTSHVTLYLNCRYRKR